MDDVIFLSNVRLSFPHLIEPQKQVSPETGKERISYNSDFTMPPDHAGFAHEQPPHRISGQVQDSRSLFNGVMVFVVAPSGRRLNLAAKMKWSTFQCPIHVVHCRVDRSQRVRVIQRGILC